MTAGVKPSGDPIHAWHGPPTHCFFQHQCCHIESGVLTVYSLEGFLASHSSLDNQKIVCLSVPIRHFICLPLPHSDHRALPEVLPVFHFSVPSFLLITLGDREAPCKVNFLQSFQSKGITQARHHHPSPPLSKVGHPSSEALVTGLCPPPRICQAPARSQRHRELPGPLVMG